jgi:methionyl-tRNA formyltransferase
VIASYSMILPPTLIAIPPRGTVNVHGGLLPEYRGPHILQWAMVNGERTTGVTIHYVDEGIDTGPVIAIETVPIGPDDDAVVVKERLRDTAASLMERWWPRIADGTAPRIAQDESRARYWPLRRPADGRIEWTMPAAAVCRLVRALASNEPGAYVEDARHTGRPISVRGARPIDGSAGGRREPGTVIGVDARGLRIAAADADVLITEVHVDGRALHGAELADIREGFGA